jgi:hypothetical protein
MTTGVSAKLWAKIRLRFSRGVGKNREKDLADVRCEDAGAGRNGEP